MKYKAWVLMLLFDLMLVGILIGLWAFKVFR